MKKFYFFLLATMASVYALAIPQGALSGTFSVSDTKQVRFSQGNLRCTIQGTDTTWAFHDHQYDLLGEANLTASGELAETIDLFGWSGDTGVAKWGISTTLNINDHAGDFADWGQNIGDGRTWRTLTHDEWTYLRETRTNAVDLMGLAHINLEVSGTTYVEGLILLPDEWHCPEDITFMSGGRGSFENNIYALEQWSKLEAAGAIFLPAAGYRYASQFYGGAGFYNSATYDGPYNTFNLTFYSWEVGLGYRDRCYGQSVRLVTDFKLETGLSFVQGDYKYTVTNADEETPEVEVAKGSEDFAVTNIVIPEIVNRWGYTFAVTAIAWSGFQDCCNAPTTVTLPTTLRRISNYAFADNEGIGPKLIVPEGVTEIGQCAFRHCEGLREVVLPSTLQSIGDAAFMRCWNISSITLNAVTPPACGNLFYEVPVTEKALYVPYEAYDTYTNTDYWKNFAVKSILEEGTDIVDGYLTYRVLSSEEQTLSVRSNYWAIVTADIVATKTIAGIEYTVTTIHDHAFTNCAGLQSITIPATITHVDHNALEGCLALTSIVMQGTTVPTWGNGVFHNTDQFAIHIQVPQEAWADFNADILWGACHVFSQIATGDSFVQGDYKYTIISLDPEDLQVEVAKGSEDFAVANIVIPEKVSQWGYTFAVTAIAWSGFQDCCNAPTTVTLPATLRRIVNYAFADNEGLGPNLVIPEGVTEIGPGAFRHGEGLREIVLPSTLQSIGDAAFMSCWNISSITMNTTTPPACGNLFYDVPVTEKALYVPYDAYDTYTNTDYWKNFAVKSIAPIGTEFRIYDDNTDCIYTYEVIAHAPYEVSIRCEEPFFAMDDLTLPSSVSHRGIDYTLTGIADRGFADARHIFRLYLPESITRIGERAFENCYWLQELTIPSTVTHIGEQILSGCTNLRRFEYRGVPDNESLWMDLCSMPQLETLITPAHTLSLTGKALRLSLLTGEHAEHSSNLRYVEITGGNINSNTLYCLSHFRNLTTLDMRLADCSTLPAEGLRNSYSLQTLVLPEGLTTIDYMAVADCKYLTTIDIPAGVERIADGAFENCRSLNTIRFLGTEVLTHIGNWAFYQCHELRNLTIPDGVTSIGLAAFYGCTYLQDLVLPASLENIEDNGFALCGQLRAMRVHAAEPPAVSSKTFESVSRSIPVTVPDAAVSAYKAAPVWQEFNIVGETNAPTGLSESLSDQQGVHKILRNGQVLILRNGDTYDMMGQKQ